VINDAVNIAEYLQPIACDALTFLVQRCWSVIEELATAANDLTTRRGMRGVRAQKSLAAQTN
jgi:hypothetical protein